MNIRHISREDRRKLLSRLGHNEPVVVFPQQNGHLRVCDLNKYLEHKVRMREVIKRYKPWTQRQKSVLGPIGSQPLGVEKTLSREAIYEGR